MPLWSDFQVTSLPKDANRHLLVLLKEIELIGPHRTGGMYLQICLNT